MKLNSASRWNKANSILEHFQSGFHPLHFTVTALNKGLWWVLLGQFLILFFSSFFFFNAQILTIYNISPLVYFFHWLLRNSAPPTYLTLLSKSFLVGSLLLCICSEEGWVGCVGESGSVFLVLSLVPSSITYLSLQGCVLITHLGMSWKQGLVAAAPERALPEWCTLHQEKWWPPVVPTPWDPGPGHPCLPHRPADIISMSFLWGGSERDSFPWLPGLSPAAANLCCPQHHL